MSQKKVDEYKKYKQNRRENIKKEQRKNRLIAAGIWGFVVLFLVCVGVAIGVTFYNSYKAKLAALPTYGATGFVLPDNAGIQDEGKEEVTEAVTEEETGSGEETGTEEATEAVSGEEAGTEEVTEAVSEAQSQEASAEQESSETETTADKQ